MSTETTLAAMQNKNQQIAPASNFEVGFTSSGSFDLMQRAAKLLAASSLVPKEYQGNIPNCTIALNMAVRVGADPLMVMQNLVIVHGRPTWSSQFLISTVNSCGRFSAIRYEFFGEPNTDSWGCRAWAIEKSTGEKLVGTDVTIAMAKLEGWHGKNGSKWKTMPQQMLMYRAGSWWTRVYAPELSMGLHTADEMRDVYDAEKLEDGSFSVNMEKLRSNPETGEIIENITAEPQPPTFDFAQHNISTQAGCREAVKQLCAMLEAYPEADRGGLFLENGGAEIHEELGRNGLGTLRNRFAELGIKLPVDEAI